jgi:hypothetical protein
MALAAGPVQNCCWRSQQTGCCYCVQGVGLPLTAFPSRPVCFISN